MKRNCLLFAVVFTLCGICFADDFERGFPYARLGFGPVFAPDLGETEFKTGIAGELAVGYRFELPFRLELAVDGARQSAKGWGRSSLDFTLTAVMMNAYLDLPISSSVTPFAGAGIGWYEIDFRNVRASSSGAAANFMAGLYMPVSENAAVQVNYRQFRELDESRPYRNHGVMVGLLLSF